MVSKTDYRNPAYLVQPPPSMFAVVFRTPFPYLSFARFPPFPLLGGVIAVKRESKHLGLWRVGISARRGQLADPYDRSPIFISSPMPVPLTYSRILPAPPSPPPHMAAPGLWMVSYFYLRKTQVLPCTEILLTSSSRPLPCSRSSSAPLSHI
jgi:hypothetical protein